MRLYNINIVAATGLPVFEPLIILRLRCRRKICLPVPLGLGVRNLIELGGRLDAGVGLDYVRLLPPFTRSIAGMA